MPRPSEPTETDLLNAELELLIEERAKLLRVAGAAAVFIANMDIGKLPKHTFDAADVLATNVNSLPEDTLRDALEAVGAEVELDVADRRKSPR